MTMYLNDDSYAKTQQLELTSKIDNKQQEDNEQIIYLCQKISQMQKNYIAMQRHYSDKIKQLYSEINEKDEEFRRLQIQMIEIKTIAIDHKKKVQQLNKNTIKKNVQPRVKSKSPVLTSRPQYRTSTNNAEVEQKSPSPKNETKKVSPTSKPTVKRTMLTKNSLGSTDSGNIQKNNTSSDKFMKKSVSPKNSYEKSKKVGTKVDQLQSIKLQKKVSGGIASFRQKAPGLK